jgi:hypothetical protein
MAGRVLPFSKTSPLPAYIEMDGHRGNATSFARKPLRSSSVRDMDSRAGAEGLGCFRGIAFAFIFQAAAGLAIYGVWRLIHHLN